MYANSNHQFRSTSLLQECQALVHNLLQPKLDKLFDRNQKDILDFSEKYRSESSQIRFMEAIALLQKERRGIETIFYAEIDGHFESFGNITRNPVANGWLNETALSLQSKEEADIEVAVRNMISSASIGATVTIGALLQRLAVLNHGRKLEESDVPGGPTCLAMAFHKAVKDMVVDHETRLNFYLLFDRFVLANTRVMLDEYNQLLRQSGILPNLKYEIQRNPSGISPAAAAEGRRGHTHGDEQVYGHAQATASPTASESLFNSILQLMNSGYQDNTGQPVTGPEQSSPLPQQAVVSAIQKLQHFSRNEPVRMPEPVSGKTITDQQTEFLASILQRIRTEREQLFTGIDRRRLPSADTQVIDLVGMMFEYMLRDKQLPSIAKAELSRLHTPYLKIAIIDKSLFTDRQHPAHRLLNALAEAGTRWVFEQNPERGILPCIRQIVQHILDEFNNDIELFNNQLQLLNNNIRSLENKAAAIEERTRQAASGREKLEQARESAASTIEQLVSVRKVPAEIRKLLGDVWLDKLMFIYLRESGGRESPSWKLATGTIETILWSIEPRVTDNERSELLGRLPDIRRQTAQALEMLSAYGNTDYQSQIALIEHYQNEALDTAKRYSGESAQAAPPADERSSDTAADSNPASGETTVVDEINDEDISLSVAEEAALDQLRSAPFGTWFSFERTGGSAPMQVKLSWYSSISGNYMFVDSLGVKALVIRHSELATLIAAGKAGIIDAEPVPFIQRALERIRNLIAGDNRKPQQRSQGVSQHD